MKLLNCYIVKLFVERVISRLYLLSIIFFIFPQACQNKKEKKNPTNNIDTIRTNQSKIILDSSSPQLMEFFSDSLNVGRKKFNKVEVFNFRRADSFYVDIKFYTKQHKTWELKQKIHFLIDENMSCNPKISDFNNDGLNDLTIVSAVAARAANQVRRLFIYDKLTDKLIEMKNSEYYPNMLYNKELNCIDAFLVHGGSTTVFLKISGDSLKEFAQVCSYDEALTVTEFDKNGKEKIIVQNTENKKGYVRFKNYKPLKEYDNY